MPTVYCGRRIVFPLRIIAVPRTGIEPARPFGHRPLKTARLPISPPGPGRHEKNSLTREQERRYT